METKTLRQRVSNGNGKLYRYKNELRRRRKKERQNRKKGGGV